MKLLIDHGANKDLKDSKNKTPLESEELLKKEYNEEKEVFKFNDILAILAKKMRHYSKLGFKLVLFII